MKKGLFRGLALALILVLLCGAALAEGRTTGNVWRRTGPGLDYEQIISFSEGKSLEYLGESSEDDRGVAWYKVSGGGYTGWVSSRYSELVGESSEPEKKPEKKAESTTEPTPTPEPSFEPTPTPSPEPTEALPVTLPALEAGWLFSNTVSDDQGESEAQPAQTPQAEAPAAPGPLQNVELSGYYRRNLVESANEIGLISYRQVESEVPFQYYDDALILAGSQQVDNIVVYGEGYTVYGVSVGMDANAARACLNAAGLDYLASENCITYEHRAGDGALFTDANGHDSCINLWVDADDIITEIDWSSYTG